MPQPLTAIIRRATQWDARNRYQSVDELIHALEHYQTPWAKLGAYLQSFGRWTWNNAALLTIFCLVAAGSIGFAVYQARVADNQRVIALNAVEAQLRESRIRAELASILEEMTRLQEQFKHLHGEKGTLREEVERLMGEIQKLNATIERESLTSKIRKELEIRRDELISQLEAHLKRQQEIDAQLLQVQQSIERRRRDAETKGAQARPLKNSTSADSKIRPEEKIQFCKGSNDPLCGMDLDSHEGSSTNSKISGWTEITPWTLDDETIGRIVNSKWSALEACATKAVESDKLLKSIRITYDILRNGEVTNILVNQQQGTALWNCIADEMLQIRFPRFSGTKIRANFELSIR